MSVAMETMSVSIARAKSSFHSLLDGRAHMDEYPVACGQFRHRATLALVGNSSLFFVTVKSDAQDELY